MVNDLSSDVVAYSIDRMELVKDILPKLREQYKAEETHQEMLAAFNILSGQYAGAGVVISRYIGGVYVERGNPSAPNAKQPFTPVPADYQKKAMDALAKYFFAPDAFPVPQDLYPYLQMQRRGYDFGWGTEDPKVHSRVLRMQRNLLAFLLDPTTLHRVVDSEAYGNGYKIDQMMMDLTKAIFEADRYGDVNTFRQNLQLEYTNALIEAIGGDGSGQYPYQARSMALYSLQQIRDIAGSGSGNTATRAHRAHLKELIEAALDKK
jgi:hypothetical protein